MHPLTVPEFYKMISTHKYVLIRLHNEFPLIGINTAFFCNRSILRRLINDLPLNIASFIPCTFHQYITNKYPVLLLLNPEDVFDWCDHPNAQDHLLESLKRNQYNV